jgi:uncharacterized protein (TIGR02391 family)
MHFSLAKMSEIRTMTEEQAKTEIAKVVCKRFIKMRAITSRHTILVDFECPDVLDAMEQRNLVKASENRNDYRPTVGTFALLGDEHELYQEARAAFGRTINALRHLYRTEGCGIDHKPHEFASYTNTLNSDEVPYEFITLGLYLAGETGALQLMTMSDDQMTVERFRVAERVIGMRDVAAWWTQRVQASREPLRSLRVPIEQLHAAVYEQEDENEAIAESFDKIGFWLLINPRVESQARPRFEAGHYADAVEVALKVVAQEVRRRTSLKIDGSDLMHQAFSPKKPLLVFEDPIPATRDSMQQGYMGIFAGAMTGIRNPKSHGMVQLDRRRCIHFIFLASLLADKIDEAVDAPPS